MYLCFLSRESFNLCFLSRESFNLCFLSRESGSSPSQWGVRGLLYTLGESLYTI